MVHNDEERTEKLPEPVPAADPDNGNVTPGENVPSETQNPGFLEIVYGTLFDPVNTFRRIAPHPPLGIALLIVTLVNAATALMSVFSFRMFPPADLPSEAAYVWAGAAPLIGFANFVLWYVKWLGYGAVLHLVAGLFGGRGTARGTLTVYGLAGLPSLLLLPFQGILVVARAGEFVASLVMGTVGVIVLVWGIVLLVLGLRDIHYFSSGRAVATVAVPALAIVFLVFLFVALLVLGIISILPGFPGDPEI